MALQQPGADPSPRQNMESDPKEETDGCQHSAEPGASLDSLCLNLFVSNAGGHQRALPELGFLGINYMVT